MVVGLAPSSGDIVAQVGLDIAYSDHAEPYPRVDLVLTWLHSLLDEPYS
jgi:hypothetical protein